MCNKEISDTIKEIKATQEIEGLYLSEKSEQIIKEYLSKKITSKTAINKIKALYNVK